LKKFIFKTAAWCANKLPGSWRKAIYRFKPMAKLVRGTLNSAVPTGLSKVKVAAGDLKGTPLYLNLQIEKDYWLGTYEPELHAAVRKLIHPGMTVYDVGANIGVISILFAKTVGSQGHVYSFEALPANIERLKQNLNVSGFNTTVEVIHAAVTNNNQPVKFFVHDSTSMGKVVGSGGRQDVDYKETIQVPGIALDDYVESNHLKAPDVIKLDIEGGETLAIAAMRRTLQTAQPLMLVELHGPDSAKAVGAVLKELSYRVVLMDHPEKSIDLSHPDHWKAYIIAFPPKTKSD
jgi:FkbM family methyltransferase